MRVLGRAGVCAVRKRRHRPAPAVHDDQVHRRVGAEAPARQPYRISPLGDWFTRWSAQTEPAVPAGLLLCGRGEQATELVAALAGPTAVRQIAAGSRDETVAFTVHWTLMRSAWTGLAGQRGYLGEVAVDVDRGQLGSVAPSPPDQDPFPCVGALVTGREMDQLGPDVLDR